MIRKVSIKLDELEINHSVPYLLLAAITLLAVILRFYNLGVWSFWFDEISTINRAHAFYSGLESVIHNLPPAGNSVPLSVIFTGLVLNGLGTSEWSARLAPAVIGVISVPALYFPIRREFGTRVGLIAALLLAIAPWHIEWSQNARFYTSLMLLYNLALFAFFYAVERDRPGYILPFLLLLYLAMSERMIALMITPVVLSYLIFLRILPFEKPPGLRTRNLLIILLPAIVFGIYEIYGSISIGNSRILDTYLVFSPNRGPDSLRLLSFIVFNLGIPLVCLGFFAGIYLLTQKSRSGLFFFLGAVVPIGLLLLANPFLYTDERYAFITLPSWIILGALAIKEIFSETGSQGKVLVIGVMVLLLADAAYGNLMYFHVNNGNRLDWRSAYEQIQERMEDGDLFVSYWPALGAYYMGQEVLSLREVKLDLVIGSGKRVWFVIDKFAAWSALKKSQWVTKNAELIDVMYLRRQSDSQLRIFLYDPLHSKGIEQGAK